MVGRTRGLPWRRLLTAALAAVAIFLYWSQVAERGEPHARDNSGVTTGTTTGATTGVTTGSTTGAPPGSIVGFTSARSLDEHYAKHGREFGSISRDDYLRMAQRLRDAPVGGPILEAVRKDGVITRFDRDTRAFIAFNRDRTIRTFFRPNDGERYWRRQAEREPR